MIGAVASADYEAEVEVIRQSFQFELCTDCGGDFDDHVIAPDMFGHAHAWCMREGAKGVSRKRSGETDDSLRGWCYGPVLCDPLPGGEVTMRCVDWIEPGVPCPWEATASNRVAAAARGMAHAARH